MGPWMGQPDPSGKFPGIYYQFNEWRDFSDVIQLPHTNEVLFVDDVIEWLFLKRVGGVGQPDHPSETLVANDIRLNDAEALTTDGENFVYACTAHALKKKDAKRRKPQAFLRFRIADRDWLLPDGVITNLRETLAARYEFIRAIIDLRKKQGGLNIEGLAWDAASGRLLFGLRAPLLGGSAALLPVRIQSHASFTVESLEFQDPITLGIPGKGIRSIQFDRKLNAFLILAGNVGKGTGSDFSLWLWGGAPGQMAQQFKAVRFREYFNPEGVTGVSLPTGEEFIFIVSDNGGGYLKLRYEELGLDSGQTAIGR